MSIALRLCVAAVLVAGIHGGVYAIRQGGMPTEVRFPDRQLEELPMQLGAWRGEATEIDPKIFPWLGTEIAVNRQYRNQAGQEVFLHSSLWEKFGARPAHPPEVCYPASGHKLVSGKRLQVAVPGGPAIPVKLVTFERDGNRIQVLYWYQLGDHVFLDRHQLRQVRWTFRGKQYWPPIGKVLLQTPASNSDQAEARLREVAPLVYAWTRDLK